MSGVAPSTSSAFAAVKRGVARIRYRLLLINVIVAVVPIVGMSFARMHERQLLVAAEADMIHEAQLVRDTHPDPTTLVAAEHDTGMAIRLLDGHGAQPDRAFPQRAPRSFVDRPEVRAALAGRYGSATRVVDGRAYLFAALPETQGGKVVGVVYVARSTADVIRQLHHLRESMFHVLLVALGITLLLTLVLATTIARPLGRLTRRAQRIASRQTAPPDGLDRRDDEIGQLARAVTAMTDELEKRARDARSLAADISHEFKTPLSGIRGAAELLRDGADDDPEARDRFLAMIVDDSARLDRLVSRLLELARVEDDRAAQSPVDVAELARACASRPWSAAVEVEVEPAGGAARRAQVPVGDPTAPPSGGAAHRAQVPVGDPTAPPSGGAAHRAQVPVGDPTAPPSGGAAHRAQVPVGDPTAPPSGGAAHRAQVPVGDPTAPPSGGAAHRAQVPVIVRGRAPALASAIDNLVANAVQHAEPDTAVRVTITRGAYIRVAVANHGPALSEAARARVWDRFYSTRVESGGSGLGLAIVRSVALAHGGTYGVRCAGGVTTFWFEC